MKHVVSASSPLISLILIKPPTTPPFIGYNLPSFHSNMLNADIKACRVDMSTSQVKVYVTRKWVGLSVNRGMWSLVYLVVFALAVFADLWMDACDAVACSSPTWHVYNMLTFDRNRPASKGHQRSKWSMAACYELE